MLVIDHDSLGAASFRNELQKHGSISLLATAIAQPDLMDRTRCSSAVFKKLLEQYAQADAIVFFHRFAGMVQGQAIDFGIARRAFKIIALDTNEAFFLKSHYNGYFAQGILSVLVAHRTNIEPSTPRRFYPVNQFDQHYQVLHA